MFIHSKCNTLSNTHSLDWVPHHISQLPRYLSYVSVTYPTSANTFSGPCTLTQLQDANIISNSSSQLLSLDITAVRPTIPCIRPHTLASRPCVRDGSAFRRLWIWRRFAYTFQPISARWCIRCPQNKCNMGPTWLT
jgi:hypothetical protein